MRSLPVNNQLDGLDIYIIGEVLTFALALIVNHRRKPENKDGYHILAMASLLWPITVLIGFLDACFIWVRRK